MTGSRGSCAHSCARSTKTLKFFRRADGVGPCLLCGCSWKMTFQKYVYHGNDFIIRLVRGTLNSLTQVQGKV